MTEPEFIPSECPRCKGAMERIPGQKRGAWKCPTCRIEIWEGDIPSWREMDDMFHCSTKEMMGLSYGALKKGRSNRSGRRRKKKKAFRRIYYFEIKPRK